MSLQPARVMVLFVQGYPEGPVPQETHLIDLDQLVENIIYNIVGILHLAHWFSGTVLVRIESLKFAMA